MKPVLVQHILRDRKKQRPTVDPVIKEIADQHNRAANLIFWFVIGIVVLGLLLA
jgi:hypothetical protein